MGTKRHILVSNIIGFLLIIGYILPTSVSEFTMNPQMRFNNFFLLDAIAVFIILYEYRFDRKRIIFSLLTLFLLFIFTILAPDIYQGESKTGNLLLYGTNIICCNVTFGKIQATKIWDTLFITMMIIILTFGVGTIFHIDYLNSILRKYYVDHLSYFLNNMLEQTKPVTFFVSHSMSAFSYTLFIVLLFIRDEFYKKQITNKILIFGFVVCMLFLKSNSGFLFLVLLYALYLFFYVKKVTVKQIVLLALLSFVFTYLILENLELIKLILSSKDNGIQGRFSEEGALGRSFRFVADFNFPTGLYDIRFYGDYLLYRDSSYLINMMRGGILLVITYTYVVIRFVAKNIDSKRFARLFILLVLLFDFGYSFTWEQRFLSGFLFMLPYLRLLTENNRKKGNLICNSQ